MAAERLAAQQRNKRQRTDTVDESDGEITEETDLKVMWLLVII